MNYFKKTFLTVVACALAAGAKAQAVDNHVYETDEITSDKLGVSSYYYNGKMQANGAAYKAYLQSASTAMVFDNSYTKNGIVVTSSNGILQKIVLTWNDSYQSFVPTLDLYTQDAPYTQTSELPQTSEGNVAQIKYPNTEFIPNANHCYWGIKNNTSIVAYLSSISVTWQLAHIRESLTPSNLSTICLPYAVAKEDMQGIKAYSIAGKIIENGIVTSIVLLEETSIEAGMPYVFIPEEETICLKYSGAKVTAAKSCNGLYGTLEKIDFATDPNYSEDYYIFKNNGIHGASNKSGVNANRAYIRMNEVPVFSGSIPSNRRAIIISENGYDELNNGQPTSISVLAKGHWNNEDAAYDVSGRNTSPLTSGPQIVIQNGKKIIPANR